MVIGKFSPIVMHGLYEFSCGSIPGRGVHYGKKYVEKWIATYGGKKMYVLKMDIHHFFASIDRTILKQKLKEVIRDARFYRQLCILVEFDRIAEVAKLLTDDAYELSEDETRDLVSAIAFDNDADALDILRGAGVCQDTLLKASYIIADRRRGVPLGYYTSQWFGNFYLKKLDHYIKQDLHAKHYVRYVDDIVILGTNKKKLHRMRQYISKYLDDNLHLELKHDWQVFRFEYPLRGEDGSFIRDEKGKIKTHGRMLDFMGFQFHYNRTTMRKSSLERSRAKAYRINAKEKITWYDAAGMLAHRGWFDCTDTYGYYLEYIKPNVNVKQLKKMVSKHAKREHERENQYLMRKEKAA